jgi:biopolymer transport protein ExbB
MKKAVVAATTLLFAASTQLGAQEASSLANLLDLVEADRVAESDAYRERLQEFEQNANRQQEILDATEARIAEQEEVQSQLSEEFDANEIEIANQRELLRDRRGDLNELFGTLQGVAGDFLSNFQNSLISAQYPGRSDELEAIIERAGSTVEQLNIGEMGRFWFFMHQELT